ncbi:MAG: magnesium transporter [Nitrospirota bacterium]
MPVAKFDLVLDTIKRFLRKGIINKISNMINKMHPADIAKVIRHLSLPQERRTVFELIKDLPVKANVISEIDPSSIEDILNEMSSHEIVMIFKEIPSDDVADILGYLPEDKSTEILQLMKVEDSQDVEVLLKYHEETAGGIMTTEFFALHEETTAGEATKRLQTDIDAEMVFYIYVTDNEGKLVGVVSLRQLLLISPDTALRKFMTTNVISVVVDTDQEEVARQVARYNILAIPVVDKDNILKGIITVDDVIDVIREEATEDMLKMAGTGEETLMLEASTFIAARYRLPWLLTNLIGGIFTAGLLWLFRLTIREVIAIVSFIPVINSMAGNIGLQSSTIIVRGLATGGIESIDIYKVFLKELKVGALMGMICGTIVGIVAYIWHGNIMLGVVVGSSMFIAVGVAATMGTLVPLFFKRFDIDPAISSGPFVTTVNDITGIILYLSLATYLLNYLM